MAGREELPGKANYFIGRDPSKWHVNVPTYARVHYHDLYPDIDLVYYGNQRQLEYDLIVQPGAEPGAIVLAFQGTERLQVNAQGDLVLETAASSVRRLKPVIYLRKYVTDTTRQGGPQVRRVMKERSHYGLVRALLAISEELVRKLLSWRHPGL